MKPDKIETGRLRLQDDAPVDELAEQLVAYLDGELSPEERSALEKRLGAEPALRTQLRDLQNGWELLDDLPLASSSATLLETTIRMAAVGGDISADPASLKSPSKRYYRLFAFAAATGVCFLLGLAFIKVREIVQYRDQLRDLPIAMHLDAYLHASDLELMRSLANMQQWKEANEIADTLGEWNFYLADQLDATTLADREEFLVMLPIEDQKKVSAQWERFDKTSPDDRRAVYEVAARVASQEDSKTLLKTMDRFAVWRESLPASERDLFKSGTDAQRQEFLQKELKRTAQNWTRQRGELLSDADVETIYSAVRQIAKLRMDGIRQSSPPAVQAAIAAFESANPSIGPRFRAYGLRRLFDRSLRPVGLGGFSQRPSREEIAFITSTGLVIEEVHGPLNEGELYILESVLPQDLAEMVESAASIPMFREELLASLLDESIRRKFPNQEDQNVNVLYLQIEPKDREQIDLLPSDRMIRSIQGEGRRTR